MDFAFPAAAPIRAKNKPNTAPDVPPARMRKDWPMASSTPSTVPFSGSVKSPSAASMFTPKSPSPTLRSRSVSSS